MTRTIKTKSARLIILCLLLFISGIILLVGTVQQAHGAGEDVAQHISIFLKGAAITNDNIRELNADYTFLVNGVPTNQKGLILGQNGCTAQFVPETGTLKLYGYDGGPIHLFRSKSPGSQFNNGLTPKDLKIELHGTNKIASKLIDGSNKGGNIYGIYNGTDGDIVIKAGRINANLIIDLENESNDVTGYGLNNTVKNSVDNGIYIDDYAIVELNAKKSVGTNGKTTAIRTGQKGVNVIGGAQLTINHDGDGHCIFSSDGDFKIDTAGEVLINSLGSGSASAVYTSKIKLVKAKKFEIRWSGSRNFRGDDAFVFTGDYAVNVDNTKKIANYRLGAPRTVKLAQGTGVINFPEAGVVGRTEGQFLQSRDEIELVGRTDVSPYVFDKWVKEDGSSSGIDFVSGYTANNRVSKVKVGSQNLSLIGSYKTNLFENQPTFNKADKTISFKLLTDVNRFAIQNKKANSTWYDVKSFGSLSKGNHILDVSSISGDCRLYASISSLPKGQTYNFREHFSDEFVVDHTPDAIQGTVSVSGTIRNGQTITAVADTTSTHHGQLIYEWYLLNKDTNEMTEIGGNNSAYTIKQADVGHQIKVKVRGRSASGYIESPLYDVEKEPYEGEAVSHWPYPEETLVETDTSLRFKGMLELEYNITDYGEENLRDEWERVEVYGEWIEFTDLISGTLYTIWVRFPETDLHSPSDSDKHHHSTKYRVEIWSVNSYEPEVEYHAKNEIVVITAPPAPTGMEFDYWSTDDQINIENLNSQISRFNMPDSSVVISAIYKNKPGVLVEGNIESYDSVGASVFIYDAALTDEEIRTDMKTGAPIHAKHYEAILGSPIKSGSKYTQAFSFEGVGEGTYKVAVYKPKYIVGIAEFTVTGSNIDTLELLLWQRGDVNGDGTVDSSDLQRLYEHIKGTNILSQEGAYAAADVNGDGSVDSSDLQRLYEHIKGTNPLT
jgi:hypothetical protein